MPTSSRLLDKVVAAIVPLEFTPVAAVTSTPCHVPSAAEFDMKT